jgi:hypothetical protein
MTIGIGRRQFISALGGATVSWPLTVRAQQAAVPVVGFLSGQSPATFASLTSAFQQGLNESGFVEGSKVRTLRSNIVGHKVNSIVCQNSRLISLLGR